MTTTKQGSAARIEVTAANALKDAPAASAWPATLTADIEAIDGHLGAGDAAPLWLTVPLSGPSAPDS